MTRKRKSFKAIAVDAVEELAEQPASLSTLIEFPPNPTMVRRFDFAPWVGIGMDDVVSSFVLVITRMRDEVKPRTATVVSYCRAGLRYFLDYLVEKKVTHLAQIDSDLIEGYIAWLRLSGVGDSTQQSRYRHAKAVLVDLVANNVLDSGQVAFTGNQFPRVTDSRVPARPLGWTDRKHLIAALKADLIAIAKGDFDGTDAAAMVILMLAVALRTGLNTTPMLELRVDCLQPHPLLKRQLLLRYVKYRSGSDGRTLVRAPRADVDERRAGMDVAAIIQLVLKRTEVLRKEAAEEHKDLLWLFRRTDKEDVPPAVVTSATIAQQVQWFVNRHNLVDEHGRRLVITIQRLRKTLENRLWQLSGGDLRAVARAMNHLPAVADAHYLLPSPEAERNHNFLGQALVASWRSQVGAGVPAEAEVTPTGRCSDAIKGERAPQNGDPCMDFMSCFTCRSYVLVEDERDLHRLFSFYWFLNRERENAKTPEWRSHYTATISLIDKVTGEKFDAAGVAAARERAHESPIKFWRTPIVMEAARGSA